MSPGRCPSSSSPRRCRRSHRCRAGSPTSRGRTSRSQRRSRRDAERQRSSRPSGAAASLRGRGRGWRSVIGGLALAIQDLLEDLDNQRSEFGWPRNPTVCTHDCTHECRLEEISALPVWDSALAFNLSIGRTRSSDHDQPGSASRHSRRCGSNARRIACQVRDALVRLFGPEPDPALIRLLRAKALGDPNRTPRHDAKADVRQARLASVSNVIKERLTAL